MFPFSIDWIIIGLLLSHINLRINLPMIYKKKLFDVFVGTQVSHNSYRVGLGRLPVSHLVTPS